MGQESNMKTLESTCRILGANTEEDLWQDIFILRDIFSRKYIERCDVGSMDEAVGRANSVIFSVLSVISDYGLSFEDADTGHGIGHLIRDYVNATSIIPLLDISPQDAFVSIVAGTLHDLGCTITDRHSESNRVLRHAEVGALLVGKILNAKKLATRDERIAISYAIAAHTNYRVTENIVCEDGITRKIEPYDDRDIRGPLLSVHLTRGVDRLDINGPCLIGREFLSLTEEHEKYTLGKFYKTVFANSIRPLLRTKDKILTDPKGATLIEHAHRVSNLADEDMLSVYTMYDFGAMLTAQTARRAQLKNIIDSIFSNAESGFDNRRWFSFIGDTMEPTPAGANASKILEDMFDSLDRNTTMAWNRGFERTIEEYKIWLAEVNRAKYDKEFPFIGNIWEKIAIK